MHKGVTNHAVTSLVTSAKSCDCTQHSQSRWGCVCIHACTSIRYALRTEQRVMRVRVQVCVLGWLSRCKLHLYTRACNIKSKNRLTMDGWVRASRVSKSMSRLRIDYGLNLPFPFPSGRSRLGPMANRQARHDDSSTDIKRGDTSMDRKGG